MDPGVRACASSFVARQRDRPRDREHVRCARREQAANVRPRGDRSAFLAGTVLEMATRVLLACLALITAACAAAPITQQPAASSPTRGGTAVVAWQEPSTLHPFYSTGTITNALVYDVAVEGLVRIDPDGNARPGLARDVPTLANGGVQLTPQGAMTVRYTLRPNLVWSDGVALSSAD